MMFLMKVVFVFNILMSLVNGFNNEVTDYTIRTDDLYTPTTCDIKASYGDHLLISYAVLFENGTVIHEAKMPGQLFHFTLDSSVSLNHIVNIVCKQVIEHRKVIFIKAYWEYARMVLVE